MSGSPPTSAAAAAAAQKAAEAAAREITVEIWTLFAVACSATILRTYARIRQVGIKGLRPDDYWVWVGVIFYACQSGLGYSVGNVAHGLANNGITEAQRAALTPENPEYGLRVTGSKIQVAGWTAYAMLIWSLKTSVLFFYVRLTEGLGRVYRVRIYVGFALVAVTFIATIFTIYVGCRPFHKYWQVTPDPGNVCQAAVSRPIIWVSFAANISTDIYLIMIPLPMLWSSSLKTIKKVLSSFVLCAGIFVLVCATLKTVFVITDAENGAELAGQWGIREAFTAVITTNLPLLFPLLKSVFKSMFGIAIDSTKPGYHGTPAGFQTIGGGNSRKRMGGSSGTTTRNTVNLTYNDSEERMVDEVKMQTFKAYAGPGTGEQPKAGIIISNEVNVTHEDVPQQNRVHAHENW